MRREDGYSLVELLAAILVGMVVLLAMFAMFDAGTKNHARVVDRAETTQRLRTGLERITTSLKSAVCTDSGERPVLTATPTEIAFVSRTASRPTGVAYTDAALEKVSLALDGTNVRRRVYPLSPTANGTLTFVTTPSRNEILLSNVRVPAGADLFTYQDPAGNPIAVAASRIDAARVRVRLIANARGRDRNVDAAADTTVLLRTDDPTDPDNVPEC